MSENIAKAVLNEAANYLDGYAGGHYMAQSCAAALRDEGLALEIADRCITAGTPGFSCEPMPAVTDDGWCEWTHPLPGYLMQCCDCKLIHEVQFQIVARDDNAILNPGEDDDRVIIFRMRRATPPANQDNPRG